MKFGIYVHIPYCLQLCPYCDFAKYELGSIPDQDHYTQLLIKEIRQKRKFIPQQQVTSIYFGGGTPSLLSPAQFRAILKELKNSFETQSGLEITMEINPGTLTAIQIEELLEIGINRFSVGAQTFDDTLLKKVGRKHSAQDTADTLSLLNKHAINFTLDLLFALPEQNLAHLQKDLETMLTFRPKHISTYYLNLSDQHFLSRGRPQDEAQVEMFDLIENFLAQNKIERYEISNFALPGFESQHNMIYWTQKPYWGIGLSAHSYLPHAGNWGHRFANPRTYEAYEKYLADDLPFQNLEVLEKHQAMTEFCYTSLRRTKDGFSLGEFTEKFSSAPKVLRSELERLLGRGLLSQNNHRFTLTPQGRILSNMVFERLTFLKEDLY